jgi:hypothetical protein
MKSIFLHFVLFTFAFQLISQEKDSLFTGNFVDSPFNELVSEIYKQTGIRIYYSQELTKQIRVSLQFRNIPVSRVLDQILQNHKLFWIWWHDNIIIHNEQIKFFNLPEFNLKTKQDEKIEKDTTVISESEKNYLTGRKATVTKSIIIGEKRFESQKSKARIRLRLKDNKTGESLIGATMFIQENGFGSVTDANGFISFAIEPGIYHARFECIGQESITLQLIIQSDGESVIKMESSLIQINEIYIYANRSTNIINKEAGLEKIHAKTIRELPTMMGERDIIRVSELLPGIVSIGEGTSGINVRGGNFDQNGFYINKIPIYNTSHAFGFFPAFNPDIVKDFAVYKGHIPAEFGGRISSIFNIYTHQGNRKEFRFRGGINPISANLTFEGPLVKDAGSFLASVRTSYSDWILKKIEDPVIRSSNAKFNDIALSANYDFNSKSQLSIFGYFSSDQFKLSDINQYQYSNKGGIIDWRYAFTASTYAELSILASEYAFETIDRNIVQLAYKHDYKIRHYESKASFSYTHNDKSKIDGGINGIIYQLNRGNIEPYNKESLRKSVALGNEKAFDGSVFLTNNYKPFQWLQIYLGLRYSFFTPLGETEVFRYFPNTPKSELYISDTLHFKKMEAVKWYHGPEVRLALNAHLNQNLSFKLAFNQTRQNLFMLNNTITISPNTQWKLADYHLNPARGTQYTIGAYHLIPNSSIELSVEGFLKKTNHLTEFKDGADFINSSRIETNLLQGTQEAKGIELMIKKPDGRLNGWIAYTYSKTIIQVNGPAEWSQINSGQPYASNYDIPHVVNLVCNYRINRRLNISSTSTYQTGRPVTYPLSVYYIEGYPVIDYSSRNEFRIPNYFRTDLSVAIEGNLKRRKIIHNSWIFGIYNLSGRRNPLSIYFKSEEGQIKGYKYSIIGTPLFTVTWLFKFGNYAS